MFTLPTLLVPAAIAFSGIVMGCTSSNQQSTEVSVETTAANTETTITETKSVRDGKFPPAIPKLEGSPLRVGYFHGGRTHNLYRALQYGWLNQEGANMHLYASYLEDQMNFRKVPDSHQELVNLRSEKDFGRTRGTSIVKAMMNGDLEGGTIGESSFVDAVQRGYPIIAVAELGHDFKDLPGKVILTRPGFEPKSVEDLRGKLLITRRAGPGDAAFLKEYLVQNGLEPGKDVTVLDQVPDHFQQRWLEEGVIDGGLYHLWGIRKILDAGNANIFKRLDWFNPELSQSVLVFRKDVIEDRPEDIQRIIDGYTKRLLYEEDLTMAERTEYTPRGPNFGLVIYLEYQGMRLPAADYPPLVEPELLEEMQDILVRHDTFDKSVYLRDHIDNSFVNDFMRRYQNNEIVVPNVKDPQLKITKPDGERDEDWIHSQETPQSLLKKRQLEIAAEKAERKQQP